MLKFTVFADAHYKKGMYATTVGDLKAILKRAEDNCSELIIHCGDLCNDYLGSREFTDALLKNEQGIKAYGLYGNHELESMNNSMQVVTPLLTNDKDVCWGTEDGKIGDGSIGYYYFDVDGYRFVVTDSNYSINRTTNDYEHNRTCSWGHPVDNYYGDSLGTVQMAWLERVLFDAAEKGLQCLVFSHATFAESFANISSDCKKIRALFAKVNEAYPKTVIMQINGHSHLDRKEVIDGVVYFSVNTTTNGLWRPVSTEHYSDESLTFELENYDKEGNYTDTRVIPIKELSMSRNTYYFTTPLSANVTVDGNKITIEGSKTEWCFGIAPDPEIVPSYKGNMIEDAEFEI